MMIPEEIQSSLKQTAIDALSNIDHVFAVSKYMVPEYIHKYNVDAGSITSVGTGAGHLGDVLATNNRDCSKRMLFAAKLHGEHFVRKGGNYSSMLLRSYGSGFPTQH